MTTKNTSVRAARQEAKLTSFDQLQLAPVDFGLVNNLMADFVGVDKVLAKKDYDILQKEAFSKMTFAKEIKTQAEYLETCAKTLRNKIDTDYDAWKKQAGELQQIAYATGEDGMKHFYGKARELIHDLAIEDEAYAEFRGDLQDFRDVEGQDKSLVDMIFFMAKSTRDHVDEVRAEAFELFARADSKLIEAGLQAIIDEREAARKARNTKK